MRTLLAICLFALVCWATVKANPNGQQPDPKQPEKKKTQPKFDPPKIQKPDEGTLKQIAEKTETLRKAVEGLKAKKINDDVLVEVEIYLKAAENIVRFDEWFTANSGKWALQTLDEGLARATLAEDRLPTWRDSPGKWVVRAYRSRVDGSIQPYAVLLPHDYAKVWTTVRRVDVVLHGRDSSLTEAKFIATHGTNAKGAPKDLGYVQLEVYGRGNNAYRWAGESDVFEAMSAFYRTVKIKPQDPDARRVDLGRIVLRGFSMGGEGTWHFGLHHPGTFCVIGPGAGFSTTHGYVGNLPKELPDYQEKCLRIYDAVDYAENVFNVPVVAYSGEKDPQKAAADNVEKALKNFKEPFKFTHLVAPGLEHQMPADWQAKAETEYRKYADKSRNRNPERVRFVTYTPRYGTCDWVNVHALEETYSKAVLDVSYTGKTFLAKTTNVRRFDVMNHQQAFAVTELMIDGEKVNCQPDAEKTVFEKKDGKWAGVSYADFLMKLRFPRDKSSGLQGPIDDAFMNEFKVVRPTGEAFSLGNDLYALGTIKQFASVWDRFFRGKLPEVSAAEVKPEGGANLVLFGDPQSNPLIKKVLPKLPITWTQDKLVVNGVEYDAKTHLPVLIYPNPLNPNHYVVFNSGHTFKEADLKGTNALLYPRLGDWAVIKPTPTAKDPTAYEVVAAGLFDENWQFPTKK